MSRLKRARPRLSPLLTASAAAHAIGAATLIAAPQSAIVVLAALASNHALIGTAGLFPRSTWLGPNITRLPPESAHGGVMALTFDDGPDPAITPRVLDLLDQTDQKATFFCIGQRAEAYSELVAAMRRRGHGVENHSHSHPNTFALLGPRRMAREVMRAQDAIEQSGGGRPTLFRAPAGIQNPWLSSVLADADSSPCIVDSSRLRHRKSRWPADRGQAHWRRCCVPETSCCCTTACQSYWKRYRACLTRCNGEASGRKPCTGQFPRPRRYQGERVAR